MRSNVVDIKTKKAIFGGELRERLGEGLEPYLKEGSSEEDKDRVASTVEQVICAALVSAATAFAVKIAHSITGKLTTNRP